MPREQEAIQKMKLTQKTADLNKSESAPLVDKLKDSSGDKKKVVVLKSVNPSLKFASLNMHASKFHHKASKEQDCTPAPKLSRTAAAAA